MPEVSYPGRPGGYTPFLFLSYYHADFSQHPTSGKYLTDDEIAEVASKITNC